MKKLKNILILLIFTLIILSSTNSFASITGEDIKSVEYTKDFKNYLNLPDKEKSKVFVPKLINIKSAQAQILNPIKFTKMYATPTETTFNLKDVIAKNVVVKDQKSTEFCWTFASLSSLETNLALNVNKEKVYDFSERHMEYATSRIFLNNEVNKFGYNRKVNSGGNWVFANTYLTNGLGAINEEDMPFEDNVDDIELSKIQNKTVTSEVYDTINFTSQESTDDLTNIKQQMKNHIKEYGSIAIQIFGADTSSDSDAGLLTEYYKNSTGAIYCDNKTKCIPNHGVSIIGWDDNYAIENFNSLHKPKNKGAWIIRNSWGTKIDLGLESVETFKNKLFTQNKSQFESQGITSASQLTEEMVIAYVKQLLEQEYKDAITGSTYVIENDKMYLNLAKEGIMYLSYEDVNAYSNSYGIVKAEDKTDYENIYQYDNLGATNGIELQASKVYLANIFNKKTTGKEYLTQVAINAPETYTCKVYVNPNGSSTDPKNLKAVKLKAGDSETFDAGYHTLEFAKAVEIKANTFVVVLEIQGTRSNKIAFSTEAKVTGTKLADTVEIETGKCLMTFGDSYNKNEWIKLSEISKVASGIQNGDSNIKAFTVSNVSEDMIETEEETADDNTQTEENEKNDTNPTNTDFKKATGKLKSMKSYTYTDSSKQEYVVMDVEVNNITRNLDNDSNEYYYYVSPNKGEENIQDWVKITAKQNDKGKLTFTINTKDIKNYDEISKSNTLYLYIREVSKKGTNTSTVFSNGIALDANVTIEKYVDGAKVENIKYNADIEKAQSSYDDTTLAPKKLPNTGVTTVIMAIGIVLVIGIVVYIRYKSISKYVK